MSERRRANKFERIQVLRYFNLNTENSVLISSEEDLTRHSGFIDRYDKFSVRTFFKHGTDEMPPHLAAITKDEFFRVYKDLLEMNLYLIVAEQIDPRDAEFAGCIMRDGFKTIIEIAYGPVTVRRVTRDGMIDERYVCYGFLPHTPNLKINEALVELYWFDRSTSYPLDECIYEFSYYKIPVGWKRQRVVFWEITGAHHQEIKLVY